MTTLHPFEVNHVAGSFNLPSGVYNFHSDMPALFELVPERDDTIIECAPFTVSMVGTGQPRRVYVPVDCVVDVSLHSEGSWWLVPQKIGEDLDYTPIEVPLDLQRPLTLREEIVRLLGQEFARGQSEGADSLEEDNDFDVDDEDMAFEKLGTKYLDEDEELEAVHQELVKPRKSASSTKPAQSQERNQDDSGDNSEA